MFLQTRERLELQGIMPERALLRLKRAGIDLYDVRKPQKNRILFTVKKKDIEKVFAIYPKVCYNGDGYTPYTVRSVGRAGIGKYVDFALKRIGFSLGVLLFCMAALYADGLVLGVEFSASSVYEREVYEALETYGVKPFSRYQSGNEDLICSKLLSLNGVEFCSVKKSGMRIVVEMRLGETPYGSFEKGDMRAKHTGVVIAITALKGTPLKKAGDSVNAGETLVGGFIETDDNKTKTVDVIARVGIACVYECVLETTDEKEAFSLAYLQAGITESDTVNSVVSTPTGNGYCVKIEYTAIESINF
ncbi:MAG: sporulation protein YqfD [Clostridia bacterium]|nr:sporulation protein YqfD [Clostridia bacterium]